MFGIYLLHPAIFVGSIISGVLLRIGTESLEEMTMLAEIEKISEYF